MEGFFIYKTIYVFMPDKDLLKNKNSELAEYLSELLGSELGPFLAAIPQDRAIRINHLKTDPAQLLNTLKKSAILNKLTFSKNGYKITGEKSSLSHSLEFFKGHFAFQGASSQIPAHVLDAQPGQIVLDMAAAPGSKTTQIGIMMQNKGELIVNDSNLNRMQALNTNTQKTGLINHCIYYLAGERLGRLFPEYFDKVLLDTPCTGLGTLAVNKEVLSWWSYNKLEKLSKIQKQLLVSAIKATKAGGEIVYSTCSVAPEENEILINEILRKYPVEVLTIDNPGMENFDNGIIKYKKMNLDSSLQRAKRIWPHKHNMEGFFIVRLLKTSEYYNKNNPKEISHIKTLSYKDETVSEGLQNISQNWGIDENVWQNFRYIMARKRIWMLGGEIHTVVKDGFTNAGLLLAEKRMNIWRLTHPSVQFFSDKITKRKISLADPDINELFFKGKCNSSIAENGYYVLLIENEPSAIVYIENKEIRIKLTHPFNIYSA
jgi:16S rRNA (cytosine1407-C5)-methyltransferase